MSPNPPAPDCSDGGWLDGWLVAESAATRLHKVTLLTRFIVVPFPLLCFSTSSSHQRGSAARTFKKINKYGEKERRSAFAFQCEGAEWVCFGTRGLIYNLQHLAITIKGISTAKQSRRAKTNRNTKSQVALTSENQRTKIRRVFRGHKRSPGRPAGI